LAIVAGVVGPVFGRARAQGTDADPPTTSASSPLPARSGETSPPAPSASALGIALRSAFGGDPEVFEPARADLPNAGRTIPIALPARQEGASLLWKPRWSKFRTSEGVVTGVSIAVALGSLALSPAPGRFTAGGILIDDGARRALRPDSEGTRLWMRDTSDFLLSVATVYPFLVDSLLVAWWHRGSSTVATQMALMNLEAMAITVGIQGAVAGLTSRERPFGPECGDPRVGESRACEERNRYRSFFSGHASQAFTSAALTCAHHSVLPLFGSRVVDNAVCIGMFGVATSVALLRVVSDQHHLSDVTIGSIVGTAVGFGVPYLLHYHPAEGADARAPSIAVTLVPTGTGVALQGIFL
jgi:membrane-associated phospholipid phosphatase